MTNHYLATTRDSPAILHDIIHNTIRNTVLVWLSNIACTTVIMSNAQRKRDFFAAFAKPKPAPAKKPKPDTPDDIPTSTTPPTANTTVQDDASTDILDTDEESTDFKLALLSSLQPSLPADALLELLLACDGSVPAAAALAAKRRPPSSITTQSSLSTFLPTAPSASRKIPFPLPPIPKFKTLHLTTPSQVPFHAPATLHPSFLPAATATSLLSECLAEVPAFGRYEFRLFDRNVSSPHTAAFYVADESMASHHTRQGGYLYNGTALATVRLFTPTMTSITPLVEKFVNDAVDERIATVYPDGKKLKHMLPAGKWRVTSAFMNCYDGAKQSVGWHSDQLTYLGPRPVIASLSLGVEREFRLRRVAPVTLDPEAESSHDTSPPPDKETETETDPPDDSDDWKWQPEGQVSLHLPHNSLLIMHAECQESWKHSVHPASTIAPHPLADNKRINITFRCYRDALTPEKIPRCKCGVACVLKTVQRVKSKMGRYFWGCQVGNQWRDEEVKDGEEGGCGFLLWARFDEDGEPIWE
ncbi:hypothetical protein Dda_8893 [Drechslerella dactyloides]|uniref:Fe2OG dioxygenase domain-containing protein n=1 Tax=Drechslerella dactyloides TaxID=74499 RepID=A0AAD6IQ90_DREDA|nr:hypothetical protein Dda_8893 [Drechslerella dactyloides]